MDEAQQRVGNSDALHAIGDGAPKDAVSNIIRLASRGELPLVVSQIWEANNGECSDDFGDGDLIERFGGQRVEGQENQFLFILPCGSSGAYNLAHTAISFDATEKLAQQLSFPTMGTSGPTLTRLAVNASWDAATSTLGAHYKGRGLGDCGVASTWQWEGQYYSQLVLISEFAKDECDGKNTDWPQVWPLK